LVRVLANPPPGSEVVGIETVNVSGRVYAVAEIGRHAVASNAIAPQVPKLDRKGIPIVASQGEL